MRVLLEDMSSGKIGLHEVPPPELRRKGLLVRTVFSAISSGTERAKLETGRKSLLSKAVARPDLARQVMDVAMQDARLSLW